MMTPETIREAALAPQPRSRLDEIVRAEMAAGRKVKDIAAEYWEIARPLHESDDLPEDADDALMDTFDALRGHCLPKYRYTDPLDNTLPSEEEIAALPRWARVAFAARCARRVLSLFAEHMPVDQSGYRELVRSWIGYADRSAVLADNEPRPLDYLNPVILDAFAGESVETEYSKTVYRGVPWAAGRAALAAAKGNAEVKIVLDAASLAVGSAERIADITLRIRSDFGRLAGLATARKWTDDTPVPADVLGPLWPEGPPQGWPADPELPKHADLPVELAVKEGLSDTAVEDEVVNLFNAINRYYIARGGQPLSLEDFQPFVPAMQLAEV